VRNISDEAGGASAFIAIGGGAAVAGLIALSTLAGLSTPNPAPTGSLAPVGDLRADVPPDPALRPWLLTAGTLCPTISPAIVAAQIIKASAWNPATQTTPGAQGLAQMTPTAWATWGRDDDGKGSASPLDGPDALMALAREDCALVPVVTPLAANAVGALSLTLAAVKAGPDAVLGAGGVPPDVAAYVSDVLALAASYVTPPASGLGAGPRSEVDRMTRSNAPTDRKGESHPGPGAPR
jgi:hypothetical protein